MEKVTFPTEKDVKRHWQAQEISLFRQPRSRDPGHSIVNSKAEVREVLSMEISGSPVDLYKTRSPATTYEDPIAKAQSLIRWHHSEGPTDEQFRERIKSVEDQMLYLLLRGQLSDNQRVNGLVKLSKLLFEAQKHQEELLHRDKEMELKRQNNLIKTVRLQEQIQERAAKRAQLDAIRAQAASGDASE